MSRVSCRSKRSSRFLGAGIILRTLVLGLVTLVASGIGHVIHHPIRNESKWTSELVESLIDRQPDYDLDTEEIGPKLGYTPVQHEGNWVNPNGTCSTPVPVGPETFEGPCRIHDLGYDALRLAAHDDAHLGAWARLGLDARLYSDLLGTCENARCRALATVYFGAVTVNSIRQGYRAPTEEPVMPWAGLSLAVVGVAVISTRSGHREGPIGLPDHGSSSGYRPTWRCTHSAQRCVSWNVSPSPGGIG